MRGIWDGTYREPVYWAHFGKRLAELAELSAGAQVLDVGTGGGAVLLPAAEKVGRHGRVVGIDIWRPGLQETLAAVQSSGLDNGRAAQMDARHLGFADETFDVVLCGFLGWDDVFDFERGRFITEDRKLGQISRVLKAQGRVGISAWAWQEDNEWMGELLGLHLPSAGSESGKAAPHVPICYSRETVAGLTTVLRHAGFGQLRILTEEKVFAYRDEPEWLAVMSAYGWRRHLAQIRRLSPQIQKRFETAAIEKLRPRKQSDGIHFTRRVIFAFGTK